MSPVSDEQALVLDFIDTLQRIAEALEDIRDQLEYDKGANEDDTGR